MTPHASSGASGSGAAPPRGRLRLVAPVLALLAVPLAPAAAAAGGYEQARAAEVERCQAIDPARHQTGLFFNPDGHRSYYERSQCLQRVAVQFRDESLCAQVRRRRAWFSSSWGYSKSQCQKLVREGIAADEAILADERGRYQRGAVTLVAFDVERNGNGRDYDIVPSFAGEPADGYLLRFALLPAGALGEPVTIHSDGYHLGGESRLRIFVRREELRERLPHFTPGRRYTLRATLVLAVGDGGLGGRWSDAFVERIFPARERTQSLDREVRF